MHCSRCSLGLCITTVKTVYGSAKALGRPVVSPCSTPFSQAARQVAVLEWRWVSSRRSWSSQLWPVTGADWADSKIEKTHSYFVGRTDILSLTVFEAPCVWILGDERCKNVKLWANDSNNANVGFSRHPGADDKKPEKKPEDMTREELLEYCKARVGHTAAAVNRVIRL